MYRKCIGGLAGIAPRYGEQYAGEERYTERWPQETVSVYVDSGGVWQLLWDGRCETGERLNESVAMLDFDAVRELIKNRLRIENMSAANMGTKTVRVTDIGLGYCIVPAKDAKDEGYTLPVWTVNYTVDAAYAHATLYYGFAISALNGANIHLE